MTTKILNQAQAEAVYSAMCALNNVGGRLHATLEQDGAVHVAEVRHGIDVWVANGGPVENYPDQSAFATAYGLQQILPTCSELVQALRKHQELLGLVSDFGTATEGVGNPDDQNGALDSVSGLLSRIPS